VIPANIIVRRKKSVKACTNLMMSLIMGRFDVSGVELSRRCRQTSLKRCSNCDGLSKRAEFPENTRGAHQMSRNKPPLLLKGPRPWRDLRRLDFLAHFSKFCASGRGHCGGDLTWRKDVLEAGESCGHLNHRQVGEGQPDHNGTFCEVTIDWDHGDLRCHRTSRIVAATLRHRALAVGAEIRRYSTGNVRKMR
jgi:hypothetical protein